jgi:hypothetical protein
LPNVLIKIFIKFVYNKNYHARTQALAKNRGLRAGVPVILKILLFMLSSAGLFKSQTTYTANLIVADSAHLSYTRTDSLVADRLRVTDTVCTAKNICILYYTILYTSKNNGLYTFIVRGDGQTTILTKGTNVALTVKQFSTATQTPAVFQVMGDGRTYIGQKKATGSYSDAMLHVDGKIASRSLYVLKPVSWADEVFDENYKLMELKTLSNYIKKHGHLPEIPSEEEIK